jgi:hypothetical protein
MALVGGKAQTAERFGDTGLFALLAHEQKHPGPPRRVVDIPLPGGGGGGGGALAFHVEQGGAESQVAGAGGGAEEGFALAQGDEQQVGGGGLVLEHAFAVAAGGAAVVDSSAIWPQASVAEPPGGEHFGARAAAVEAQRHRQRTEQRSQAVVARLATPRVDHYKRCRNAGPGAKSNAMKLGRRGPVIMESTCQARVLA